MAYSLYEKQQVKSAALDGLYDRDQLYWDLLVAKSHIFAELNFQAEDEAYIIHPEDVADFLMPILKTNQILQKHLGVNKFHEKYWVRYFCDYILDRYWDKFQNGTLPPIPPLIFQQPQKTISSGKKQKTKIFSFKHKN